MGRKSIKENKNIYQLSRESAGLTREAASEEMVYISDDRIEKIESEKVLPHPEEILTMAECYKNATLCNYFCSNECPIGRKYVPEIEITNLHQITLEVLNSLSVLDSERNRLIEITVDGIVSEDEQKDFDKLLNDLQQISNATTRLRLWLESKRYEADSEG